MVARAVRVQKPLKPGRSFAFTSFDVSAAGEDKLRDLSEHGAVYLIFNREVCPATKRPHLQGYVRFDGVKRPKAVLSLLPRGTHCENAVTSAAVNRVYCSKDYDGGTGDYEEFGDCPLDRAAAGANRGEQVKAEWDAARIAAAEGRFDDIMSSMYIRNMSAFHKIHQRALEMAVPHDNDCLRNYWYWGSTGCGKSKTARLEFPDNLYLKAKNKWWGGYVFEPVVIVDDVDPTHQLWIGAFLKEWSDHYRFSAEIKNGGVVIRPKILIVTSQYPINQIFADPETVHALERRFVQRKFGKLHGESFWHPDIEPVDIALLCTPLPSDNHYIPEPDRVDPFVFPHLAVRQRIDGEDDNDNDDDEDFFEEGEDE